MNVNVLGGWFFGIIGRNVNGMNAHGLIFNGMNALEAPIWFFGFLVLIFSLFVFVAASFVFLFVGFSPTGAWSFVLAPSSSLLMYLIILCMFHQ
ncbi:unnamed protein product [Camellia sinensis]